MQTPYSDTARRSSKLIAAIQQHWREVFGAAAAPAPARVRANSWAGSFSAGIAPDLELPYPGIILATDCR